jgi:hypothetical protein
VRCNPRCSALEIGPSKLACEEGVEQAGSLVLGPGQEVPVLVQR